MKALLQVSCALVALSLFACTLEPTEDLLRGPQLISTTPEHLSEGNPRNVRLSFCFDAPLDPASIDRSSIKLYSGEIRQGGEVTYDPRDRCLRFIPRGQFRREIAYDATLGEGLRGLRYGIPVAGEVLTFVTTSESREYDDPATPDFAEAIAPVFEGNCAFSGCHGAVSPSAGLDLSTPRGVATTAIGTRGRGWPGWVRIEPSSTAWSYLVYKVLGEETLRGDAMPPGERLTSEEIDLLVDWIADGAKVDVPPNDP